jgi:molybdopterin-containing oxidoreductase family iron-sulfur binding subunit
MDDKKDKSNGESRREFLQKIGLIGAGTVLAGAATWAGYDYQSKKKAGDRIKVLTAENEVLEVDVNDTSKVNHPIQLNLTELQRRGREGIPGRRWIWVIDLSKCRNARKCMTACQSAHHLRPEQSHINVLKMKESKETPAFYMPKPCQHCDNPPCVSVCPVGATFKRPDGPVLIDNERCIGCRFCIAACPYSARMFQWQEPPMAKEDEGLEYDVELNIPQRKGTITKCLMSSDRLRVGKLPYCVSACPNGVYYFGDENEDSVTNGTTKETVRLSKLLEDNAGYHLMAELGTKPRVIYLPAKGKSYPFQENDKLEANERLNEFEG